jgi:hypothetical protein
MGQPSEILSGGSGQGITSSPRAARALVATGADRDPGGRESLWCDPEDREPAGRDPGEREPEPDGRVPGGFGSVKGADDAGEAGGAVGWDPDDAAP